MATAASVNGIDLMQLCLVCVGGLNRISSFLSDAAIAALSGGSADTAFIALVTSSTAGEHHEVIEIARQVNVALDYAQAAGVLNATDVAAATTLTGIKQIFVDADPTDSVSLTSTNGDNWLS